MGRRGRPMVNGERDRRIYTYVEVERRKGLSLRRAYAKAAKRGGFGAIERAHDGVGLCQRTTTPAPAAAACADCRRAQCAVPGRRAPDFSLYCSGTFD